MDQKSETGKRMRAIGEWKTSESRDTHATRSNKRKGRERSESFRRRIFKEIRRVRKRTVKIVNVGIENVNG